MTRPRISGAAASCRLVLDSEMKVMLAAPTSGSTTTMAPNVGMTLATSTSAPNTTPAMPSLRRVGRARLAATRPPTTAPRPMAEVMQPVAAGAGAERVAGDERQADLELVGEGADGRHQQQGRAQGRVGPHVAEPLAQLALLPGRGAGPRRARRGRIRARAAMQAR